jgi:hypothetical protein
MPIGIKQEPFFSLLLDHIKDEDNKGEADEEASEERRRRELTR